MQAFGNATDVRLVVPLLDADSNELSVTAISYRVTNAAGAQVIALTPLSAFESLSPEAVITIAAVNNTLAAGAVRDLRAVELHCVHEGNTVVLRANYTIELADVLVVGVNSFQSLAQAEFNAAQIPNLSGWAGADAQQRVAALIEAREHICRLSFMPLAGNRLWGQNSLNFVPEGSYPTSYVGNGLVFGGDLSEVLPAQFDNLPQELRAALNRAQIVEADAILGGDPIEVKRQAGVLLDTVGESKMMFRDERPLQLPVCRRALGYLSKFITFAKTVGR